MTPINLHENVYHKIKALSVRIILIPDCDCLFTYIFWNKNDRLSILSINDMNVIRGYVGTKRNTQCCWIKKMNKYNE